MGATCSSAAKSGGAGDVGAAGGAMSPIFSFPKTSQAFWYCSALNLKSYSFSSRIKLSSKSSIPFPSSAWVISFIARRVGFSFNSCSRSSTLSLGIKKRVAFIASSKSSSESIF